MKRNQSATQMINIDTSTPPLTCPDSKKQAKHMRSFYKFYDSLIKLIKDCNPNKYVDTII